MKIIKIISLGKAKYRSLTLGPIVDNSKNVSIFTDYPVSLIKCFIFSLINKNIIIELFFCDGNSSTLNSKILKFFFKIKNINILWFNNLNETEEETKKNISNKNLIFFPEQIKYKKENLNVDYLISYPKNIKYSKKIFQHDICYISEVKKDINQNNYPNLFNLDFKKKKIDDLIWLLVKKNKLDIITNYDFIYDYFKNYYINITNTIFSEIYCLIKNRIRFLGIKKIANNFKNRLLLVGKSWNDIGFKTYNDNYNYQRNIDIYNITRIPIDYGSQCGEYPIYLRTYEILNHSNWILQSKTRFSINIYKKFTKYVAFNSIEEMFIKIKNQLKESDENMNLQRKNFSKFLSLNKKNSTKNSL
jgi:hypothetical protein